MNTHTDASHNYVDQPKPTGEDWAINSNSYDGVLPLYYVCKCVSCYENDLVPSRCDRRFHCVKELKSHLQIEHLASLPPWRLGSFRCRWEECTKLPDELRQLFWYKPSLFDNIVREHISKVDCKCRECEELPSLKGE